MESKEMLELRYKRLNYYNKLINKPNSSLTTTDNSKSRSEYFQLIDNLTLNNKTLDEQKKRTPREDTKLSSMQFLDNFFDGAHINSDDSMPKTNKKLEEFKKVVETSYNLHVLKESPASCNSSVVTNKNEFISKAPVNESTSEVKEDLKLRNIFASQLSTESSLDSYRTPENEQSFRSNENTTLSYKIPYMSAYNIYAEEAAAAAAAANNNNISFSSLSNRRVSVSSTMEAHNIMEKYLNSSLNGQNQSNNSRKMSICSNEEQHQQLQPKPNQTSNNKLSSSGSSLNASPTSQSSSSSSFNLKKDQQQNQQQLEPLSVPIQVKPPETPRSKSQMPSFRKNLLRLSIDTAKSLDLKKSDSHEPTKQSVKLADSLDVATPSNTNKNDKLIENIFSDKPVNAKSTSMIRVPKKSNRNKTKSKSTIFKLVNESNEDGETVEDVIRGEDYSNEDKNDTFDIFSSQESLEKTIEESVKKINLNIDLGLLSDHDNDESQLVVNNNYNKKNVNLNTTTYTINETTTKLKYDSDSDQDCSSLENVKLTSNVLSSGRQQAQQTKPDIIPNLMLDLIDDDKSTQSVAASLAKSMCKEIDYQKEMEILYTLASKETTSQANQSQREVFNANSKQATKLTLTKSSANTPIHLNKVNAPSINASTTVLKPQASELPIKAKNPIIKPPQSARQQRLIKHDIALVNRPESAAEQTLNYNRNSRLRLSKIDLTNQQNIAKKPSQAVKKPKNFLQNSRDSSISKTKKLQEKKKKNLVFLPNRPSSAMSNLNETRHEILDIDENRSKSTLFFDYSKLITIESNLKQASMSSLQNLKQNEEEEDHENNFSNSSELIGDQEMYKSLFLKEENHTPQEANWIDLPDEIWLKIIKLLDHKDLIKFGSCCKKFRNLFLDSSLWRKITMKYKYEVRDEWLTWIGDRRPNELNIIQCNGNITLSSIVEMFRTIGDELKTLNLSRCSNVSLSGDNFALQASIRCPNVTNLDLSWTLLSNQTLKLITDSFRKIESINLSGCSMISEDGFNFFIQRHGETLKNLEISGLIHFSANSILNVGVYCRELEKLNISNCHRMTNESIMEACPQWLKLKFLDLRGIKSIKNNCISNIVRRCTSIEGLALGECIHLSDASILEIATYKPRIKYLDINGCKKITDNSIRSIANYCAQLEYLNLRATNITDIGLITLANGKCNRTLEELNLSYLPISELILIKMLKNATNLKRIQLYGCYNIKKIDEIKKKVASENDKHIAIFI